jgi:hypothetical protein
LSPSSICRPSLSLSPPPQGAREQALIAYASKVVQALGIFHGPSHMEVMFNETTGPCLVEVGSRCHGGEGTWVPVAEECLGYSQLDTNLNAFLRPDRFDALPFEPGMRLFAVFLCACGRL